MPDNRNAPGRQPRGESGAQQATADRTSVAAAGDILTTVVTRTVTTETVITRSIVRGRDGNPLHSCGCPGPDHDREAGCQVGLDVDDPSPCAYLCQPQLGWQQIREDSKYGCRFRACPNYGPAWDRIR